MNLELVVRYTGIAVALLGAFVAAPGGSRAIVESITSAAGKAVIGVRALFGLFSRKGQSVEVNGPTATTEGYAPTGAASGGHIELTGNALQLARIDREIKQLQTHLGELRDEVRHDRTILTRQIEQERDFSRDLASRFTGYTAERRRADADALPAIGIGVLLSTLPSQLVRHTAIDAALLACAFLSVLWYVWPRIRSAIAS